MPAERFGRRGRAGTMCLLLLAFMWLAVPDAIAQITVGTVTGVVRDDQKLALPGVNIELVNEQTGDVRRTVSNEARSLRDFRGAAGAAHPETGARRVQAGRAAGNSAASG